MINTIPGMRTPPIKASFAPVHWEPLPGSGERICVMVILTPDMSSATLLAPAAHVVINSRRLRAMLGAERGESVLGILRAAAEFLTRRLVAGAEIAECTPPFKHFMVGQVRQIKGFTAEQVLDAAVGIVSAFGSAEDLLDEANDQTNHSTPTTREFLARVQTAFAPADDDRRRRFMRKVGAGSGEVTIDYAHERHLVQFASAPLTERQSQNMRREAESKMLETLTVQRTVMGNQGKPRLFINVAPLHVGGLTSNAEGLANQAVAHYLSMAKVHDFETRQVESHEDAVHALLQLA